MRRTGHPLPGVNGYINDMVAIPVIANLGLWFQRVFVIRNNYYVLAPWHVIFIVVYVSVIFEIVLPHYSKMYTADWVDLLLYVAGGIFFYKIINDPFMPNSIEKI